MGIGCPGYRALEAENQAFDGAFAPQRRNSRRLIAGYAVNSVR
jgi:hypothetical protein